MKIRNMMVESFECVKINGILRNLNNDEMRIYKKVKENGKLFKADLEEFDQTVASSMVSKGLLRRVKAKQENGKKGRIYFIARGRNGKLTSKPLEEVAPPDREIESWIRKNKKAFKDRYGEEYGKFLYGKAWKKYNGKKPIKEGFEHKLNESLYIRRYDANECISKTYFPIEWIAPMGKETKYCAYFDDSEWVVAIDEEIPTDTYFNINSDKVKAGFFISNVNTGMVYKVSGIQEDTLRLSNPKNKEFKSGLHLKAFFEALLNRYLVIVDDSQPLNDMPENEPESSGEEFDESYLGESVLMEDDDEMQEAYREVLDIISDYENGNIRRAEDVFAKLCEEGYWRHETLFDYDSEYADACEDFYDSITEAALDSGNYDAYSQGEVDVDATIEAIDEEDLGTLWEKYAEESTMREYLDNIIENVSGEVEYTTPQDSEPTWSGEESEFGQVQQSQDVSTEDDEEETIDEDEQQFVNNLRNLMANMNHQERRERMRIKSQILDLIKDYVDEHGSYTSYLYDQYENMCQHIRDEAYSSGDFNRYEDGEYDSDATWDNMREYDDAELVERHVDSSVIDNFLFKIQKICSKALGIEDDEEDTNPSSEEPESTGEEFDESYLGESVLMENSFYEEYYGDIYEIIKGGRERGDIPEKIFRELVENGFWFHNYLYNHDRDYSSLIEEFENVIVNTAMESGNFDVYRDGTDLDIDATSNKIDEESYGYLWYTYADDTFIKERLEVIMNYLHNQQSVEPMWNGDDEQNSPTPQANNQLTDVEMELVDEIQGAIENLDVSYESRNKIIDLLKKIIQVSSDTLIKNEYEDIISHIRDKAWESGDFDVYEKEYDDDATREAIYNETTSDLVDGYVNRDEVREFIDKLMDLCEQELNDDSEEEDEDNGEDEPEEDGSEWMEESYEPYNVSSLLNKKVINNKDNKVGKVTSIGFHRVDGKKVDDIFITDLMSKEEIKLSKKEFSDNWDVLPYEKEIKKQDDSDDEEIYRLMRNIMLT